MSAHNLFNAARVICESFTYDPGHSDLDDEQPIAIHCTLGDWRRLNSALMLAGQRSEPEGVALNAILDMWETHKADVETNDANQPEAYDMMCDLLDKALDTRRRPQHDSSAQNSDS